MGEGDGADAPEEEEHAMKFAYADPPYPNQAHRYKDHKDFAGEVDHAELVARLERDYDGWLLHTRLGEREHHLKEGAMRSEAAEGLFVGFRSCRARTRR